MCQQDFFPQDEDFWTRQTPVYRLWYLEQGTTISGVYLAGAGVKIVLDLLRSRLEYEALVRRQELLTL